MRWDEDSSRGEYIAQSYINILDEVIETIYEPGTFFIQDNAPIHTAKKVKKWFADKSI